MYCTVLYYVYFLITSYAKTRKSKKFGTRFENFVIVRLSFKLILRHTSKVLIGIHLMSWIRIKVNADPKHWLIRDLEQFTSRGQWPC
jgi:hypothetical protein